MFMGSHDLTMEESTRVHQTVENSNFTQFFTHPDYDVATGANDIAIIRLNNKVEYTGKLQVKHNENYGLQSNNSEPLLQLSSNQCIFPVRNLWRKILKTTMLPLLAGASGLNVSSRISFSQRSGASHTINWRF